MQPTFLNTPFEDKDRVKALGARWNAERRQWCVPAGIDLAPFFSWLPAEIRAQHEAEAKSLSLVAASVSTPAPAPSLPASNAIPLSRLLLGVSQAVAALYREGVWTMVEVVNARSTGGHHYLEVSERNSSGKV